MSLFHVVGRVYQLFCLFEKEDIRKADSLLLGDVESQRSTPENYYIGKRIVRENRSQENRVKQKKLCSLAKKNIFRL